MEGLMQAIYGVFDANPELQLLAPGGLHTLEAPPKTPRPMLILVPQNHDEDGDTSDEAIVEIPIQIFAVADELAAANRACKVFRQELERVFDARISTGDTTLSDGTEIVGIDVSGGAVATSEPMDDGTLFTSARLIIFKLEATNGI